jgi:ATP synthase protein I
MDNRTAPDPASRSTPEASDPWEDEVQAEDFKPLTRHEAQQWRSRQPPESVWRVVRWQAVLAAAVVLVAGLLTRRTEVAWSALYGALCIVMPTAVMAYGLSSSALSQAVARMFPGMARVSLAAVMFWEGVKVLLVLVMLMLAPRMVPSLSWLALVAGLVVVLKAYWLEFWFRSRRP